MLKNLKSNSGKISLFFNLALFRFIYRKFNYLQLKNLLS
jgi:hypothetical protein